MASACGFRTCCNTAIRSLDPYSVWILRSSCRLTSVRGFYPGAFRNKGLSLRNCTPAPKIGPHSKEAPAKPPGKILLPPHLPISALHEYLFNSMSQFKSVQPTTWREKRLVLSMYVPMKLFGLGLDHRTRDRHPLRRSLNKPRHHGFFKLLVFGKPSPLPGLTAVLQAAAGISQFVFVFYPSFYRRVLNSRLSTYAGLCFSFLDPVDDM